MNNWEIPSKKVNRTALRDQKFASEAREVSPLLHSLAGVNGSRVKIRFDWV